MYASGNKITIKRKASGEPVVTGTPITSPLAFVQQHQQQQQQLQQQQQQIQLQQSSPSTNSVAALDSSTPLASAAVESAENEFKKPKQVKLILILLLESEMTFFVCAG